MNPPGTAPSPAKNTSQTRVIQPALTPRRETLLDPHHRAGIPPFPGDTAPLLMKFSLVFLLSLGAFVGSVSAQEPVASNVPYVEGGHQRQVLDIYAPPNAKNLPVVFWIHGGGWQTGDKRDIQLKPKWFMDQGFVFVSTNYRLLPEVDMGELIRDVARSFGWAHRNISRHGGDPSRLLIGGHSAGAQIAAILSTDDQYLKAEGVSLEILTGCVPVDGDTYDIPAIIETAETRLRVHGFPPPVNGHRLKFGHTAANHVAFSAVSHIAAGKGIPPFLILHVADHPDTTAQAKRLSAVLKASGIATTVFAAGNTNHSRLNESLGEPGDAATAELLRFVTQGRRK